MERKKLLKLIIGVTLVAVLAIALPLMTGCAAKPAAPTPTPEAELPTYTWRMQATSGPTELKDYEEPWREIVEAALAGRANVKIDIFLAGELMPDDQMLHALDTGALDFALGHSLNCAPPIDIVDFDCISPFVWNSPMELLVMWELRGLKEIWIEAYEEIPGVKFLGMFPTDPNHLLSTRPIWKYEDIKGLKINSTKAVAAPFIEAGATSVFLPFEEFYTGAQTGIVDAIMWGGSTEAYRNGWYEVYPYFLSNQLNGGALCWIAISKDLWNSLPSDIQATLSMSMHELALHTLYYYYEGEMVTRQYFTQTTLSDEDMEKLKGSVSRQWDELAKKSPRCARVVQILRDYNAEVEAAGWWR